MHRLTVRRASRAILVAAVAVALALVPQVTGPLPAAAQANPNTVIFCGPVTAFTAATATATGTITIGTGGPVLTIAAGTSFTGPTLATNANICIVGTTNSTGQLVSGFVFTNPNPVAGGITVCGNVTAVGTGSLNIGGASFTFASGGATFTGLPLTTAGPLCISFTLNASGQVTGGIVSQAAATSPVTVCGAVTAFTAATSSAAGTITISGVAIPIASGTTFTGVTVASGSTFCLQFRLNSAGQISSATASVPLAATVYYGHRHQGMGGPVPYDD
jgi:hypothetical protein